jgi:CheY-like chemotaxis protein
MIRPDPNPQSDSQPFADVKLLLVEDMEPMRNILKRLLIAMGCLQVSAVRNGEEAWSALQRDRFDLVLCDWNMPKMSGYQLLEKVRSDPGLSLIPFIMITGENTSTQVQSAMASGVTDFIVKPFTAALLERRLKQALNWSIPDPN